MKKFLNRPLFSAHALAAAVFCGASGLNIAHAEMNEPSSTRHVLNLNDVEIAALIEDVSIVTGYTFIVHPDVKGRVTVMSQTPLSTEDVFQVFLSTLRVHGYAAVPASRGVYRIVPEVSAVGEASVRRGGPNEFVTEIVKLDYFNAIEAAQMVKPLIDAQGQVVANARSNTIVVVDYASNMPRLREIIGDLDRDRSVVQTVALRNVPAGEMEDILTTLQGGTDDNGVRANFSAVSADTSNAIVIRGDERSVARAVAVAQELDSTDPVRDNIRVIRLLNTDAVEMLPILESMALTMSEQRAPGDTAGGPGRPTIAVHPSTNSLVISADYETLIAIEKVVEALDVRRPQVLLEGIIVEMSDTTARDLGLQFLLAGRGNDGIPFASSSFSNSAPNLLALTGALIGDDLEDQGFDPSIFADAAVSSLLGSNGGVLGFGGQNDDALFGVIVNAVQQDVNSNVLSLPFLMTLDNAEASVIDGQKIPITTGEVLGDANTNPFRTVNREEIGVKLYVTPQVGEGDTVRLNIKQEVSNIVGAVSRASDDLITTLRSVETTVLADDGEIIVLGGLISQTETDTQEKIPLLGDIPVAGRLFRSEGKSTQKRHLMVFIRPTIVRGRDDSRAATQSKYRYIRAEQLMRDSESEPAIDRFVRDVLGAELPD